ncbi:MAG: hypothetical protein ACKVRN_03235 [Pyrinomonadaceae bacterium]
MKNKIWGNLLLILLFANTSFGQTGWLSGTAAFTDRNGKKFLGEAQEIIVTIRKGKEISFLQTDANGDYLFNELPAGKYCLMNAKDRTGKLLRLSQHQIKCFTIRAHKYTQFNLMFLK